MILSYNILIPAIVLALTYQSFISMNNELNKRDESKTSIILEREYKQITIQEYIANNDGPELKSLKNYVLVLSIMKSTSIISIIFTIFYLLLIKISGKIASKNRRILLVAFRPLYYLTSFILIISTLINGFLLFATLYYSYPDTTNKLLLLVFILIIVGIFIAIGLIVRSVFVALGKYYDTIPGRLARKGGRLSTFIKTISDEYGIPEVDNIIVGKSLSFFVTESALICDSQFIEGRTLCLCSLQIKYLSTDELKSIIIHELAHFKGEDTKYSIKFYPIYMGVFHAIERLHENMHEIWYLTMMPAISMYSFFINSFTEAESKLSRERELVADNEAIKITSATVFSSALIKSIIIINIWIKAVDETEEDVSSLTKVAAKEIIASYFYQLLNNIDVMQYCTKQILDKSDFHPFDSHPTLDERLKNSGVDLDEILCKVQIREYNHDFLKYTAPVVGLDTYSRLHDNRDLQN